MKKLSLMALLLCMALTLTACAQTDIGEYYRSAQLYLGCGDYDYAAELFTQLGEYEDSAEYALYAAALQAIEDEKYDLARANLHAIAPFKSSARYLTYLDALDADAAGEKEQALALYTQLGSFADAHLAVERLNKEIPEAALKEGRTLMTKGQYEEARELLLSLDGYGNSDELAGKCTDMLDKAAYDAAEKLAQSGDLLGAMAAFTAMGDTLGAAEQAAKCLADIHKALDEQFAAVTLATAPALMDAYAALGEDATAKARIDELNARFGCNLEILTMTQPYVMLGKYPQAESGEEKLVLWRVLKTEGSTLTLLSENVLDASAEAAAVPLTFTEAEKSAVSEVMLPSMVEMAGLTDLTCTTTPYAQAQGADASYWLRDSLENGQHPMINAAGALTLPGEDVIPGVRPMIAVDLEKIAFTAGSGTAEEPFCIN